MHLIVAALMSVFATSRAPPVAAVEDIVFVYAPRRKTLMQQGSGCLKTMWVLIAAIILLPIGAYLLSRLIE